ncbi:MAG: alpha/beta hydrolase [Solirubrobacterales bacterium]
MIAIYLLAAALVLVVAANLVFGRLPKQPPAGGGVVETAHGPIHYLESVGEGTPIVFIHGMPSTCREFDRVRTLLPGRHTIAFDRPGYAWSSGAPQDFGAQLDAVVEAAKTLGVERATVVGHSFGGLAALGLAIRRAEFVDRLLLLAPAAGGSRISESLQNQARWIQRIEKPVIRNVCDLLFLRIVRRHAARVGAVTVYGSSDDFSGERHVAESMLARHNSVKALAHDRLLFNDAERMVTKNLKRIQAPTVILHGDADTTVPLRNGRRLHEALHGSELVEIAADHHLPVKDVGAVLDALARLEAM